MTNDLGAEILLSCAGEEKFVIERERERFGRTDVQGFCILTLKTEEL